MAALGIHTGGRQHQAAQGKLHLNLYARRFAVYEGVMRFLRAAIHERNFNNEALFNYQTYRAEAVFLFDGDLVAYLDELCKTALHARLLLRKVNLVADEGKRGKWIDEEEKAFAWLAEQLTACGQKFAPHLHLPALDLGGESQPQVLLVT